MADFHVDHLLIGGGLAATSCAEQLREQGADGSIAIVHRETGLPYDRPPCSKEYLRGEQGLDEILLHPTDWYAEHQIEVLTRTSAMKLDTDSRTVKLSDKRTASFGQALLATGAGVRRLQVDGCELDGIHYLRTFGNSDAIRADAEGRRVVLIGGSYIASEVAASLTELGAQCTLVMREQVALSNGFGEQAGRYFQRVLEDHGVVVHGGEELERFEGEDGRISRVVMKSGLSLETDVVVVGVGAKPDISLARTAGLRLGEAGGVELNSRLQTAVPGIYAAGDIAEYDSIIHRRPLRVEHWDVAINQGRAVAANMLGADEPYEVVPYFFSDLSMWASLEYVGPASEWDHEEVRGSFDAGEFTVWYLSEGRVVAALTVGRSDDLDRARALIKNHDSIDPASL